MKNEISNGVKNKNLVTWIVGAILLLGMIGLVATNNDSDLSPDPISYSASALTAVEDSFDFSTISMKNGEVSHQFEIRNDGEEPVVIEKVYTSCMCTVALITDNSGKKYGEFSMPGHGDSPFTSIEIGPGESAIVEAVFDPAAHGPSGVGLAERSIYLETNSAKSPKLELLFKAMVVR